VIAPSSVLIVGAGLAGSRCAETLRADFARLPELMGRTLEPPAAPEPEPALTLVAASEQLGLF